MKPNITPYPFLDEINNCQHVVNPPSAPEGLHVLAEWLLPHQETMLIEQIMKTKWNTELSGKRPTQHYGMTYTGRHFDNKDAIQDWGNLKLVAERIEKGLVGIKIQQCLVNYYYPDTGISAHTDRNEPLVFGVSLGADTNMIWTNSITGASYEAFIPRRSLYIMLGESSFIWKHSIPVRKSVKVFDSAGAVIRTDKKSKDYARISITFRHFNQTAETPLQIVSNVVN